VSKYMQLKVMVTPYYEKDFAGTYPNLARHLKVLDSSLVKGNPSLYELAGKVDNLLYAFDGTQLREVLLPYKEKLNDLHKSIEGNIADWRLAQADRLLHSVEDIFNDIESALA
jgi:hypothetical protein